jgi:outer membrane protein assembly factor BamB
LASVLGVALLGQAGRRLAAAQPTALATTHRGDPARTGRHPGPGPTGDVTAHWQTVLARHPSDTGGWWSPDPAVVDGTIYAGVSHPEDLGSGELVAIDAATGAERWRVPLGLPLARSPSVVGGVAYVTASDWQDGPSMLVAVDAITGAVSWRIDALGAWASPTAVVDGLVYVSDGGGTHAFEATTGARVWSAAHTDWPFAVPAVAGGTVYVGTGEGTLLALDGATGAERWAFDAGQPVPTPVVGPGLVLAVAISLDDLGGAATSAIVAIDPADGQVRWRTDLPDATPNPSAAVAAGTIYISASTVVEGAYRNVLAAFAADTGFERWRATLEDEADDYPGRSPVVAGERIYAGLSDVRVFDDAGREVARYGGDQLAPEMSAAGAADPASAAVLSGPVVASLAVADGVLYAVADAFEIAGPGGVTLLAALAPKRPGP